METIDLTKTLKQLYAPSAKQPAVVYVPPAKYLMIDGAGDPNSSASFEDAVQALYSLSYTLKFMLKKGNAAIDFKVMPLEGLWWADDMEVFMAGKKEEWLWTLMIMQPEFITEELLQEAVAAVAKKKELATIREVRLETYHEGLSVQIMHLGPYSEEGPTIARMHQFAQEQGYALTGKHHEIYLGDPRKAAPEKLKTVLRQPVRQ